MTGLVDSLLGVPPAVAYLLIGALVFAEAAIFVGFVLPGETAVVLGGFLASPSWPVTAFLRAVMPALVGLSQMRYPRFLAFNAAGGLVWGVGVTLLGYFAGASYQKVESVLGPGGAVLLVLIALVAFVVWRRHRSGSTTS